MKILHVIPTYLPALRYGGPAFSTHALCKALVLLGHEVHVCTTNVDGPGDLEVPIGQPASLDGVTVWYFRCTWVRRLNWSIGMADWLWRNAVRYDVVHIHSMFSWPTLCASRIASWRGVPYLLTPRGSLVPGLVRRKSAMLKRTWLYLFDRATLRHAQIVHTTTASEARALASFGWRLPEIEVIPHGADEVAVEARREAPPPPLLYLGRISWEKGLDRLVAALQFAPAVRVWIVGNDETGYRHELEALAERCGVAERIKYCGPAYGEHKRRFIRECAALVLPSHSENFGNVVLEAWAQGRAVIVTPEVGLAEAVTAAAGGVVASGDAASLGQAMDELARDVARADAMGAHGRAAVQQDYQWPAIARRMADQYARIAGVAGR